MVTQSQTDFTLTKWYLDCISNKGEVFVGYSARLRWKRWQFSFANCLIWSEEAGLRERKTLQSLPAPRFRSPKLVWSVPPWKLTASWESLTAALELPLPVGHGTPLHWHCHLPRARSEVTLGEHRVTGLGYAEQLEVRIKPWQLPFRTLYWGRFLSDRDTVIWIAWSGEETYSNLFHNGSPFSDAVVTPQDVRFHRGTRRLSFSDTVELRQGRLRDTVLANLTRLTSLFPQKVGRIREQKWRSRGHLTTEDGSVRTGWAIHEVVVWE